MATLVLYDSLYGNTERIAKAIARGLGGAATAGVAAFDPATLAEYDLIVVGGPTHRFGVSTPLATFLGALPGGTLARAGVAAFDTRVGLASVGVAPLRLLMRTLGERAYAARKVATALERAGGRRLARPEGFLVTGMQGPLADGELHRAEAWGHAIATAHAASALGGTAASGRTGGPAPALEHVHAR